MTDDWKAARTGRLESLPYINTRSRFAIAAGLC